MTFFLISVWNLYNTKNPMPTGQISPANTHTACEPRLKFQKLRMHFHF